MMNHGRVSEWGSTVSGPGVFADLAALRACWHPVAFGHELAGLPVAAELLGEPLVLWRGTDHRPRANLDLCVHRGTALSLGRISGDELVCPYHGWRYRADGRCSAIPQLDDPTRVPAKARIPAFACQERYGLVWVALEQPRWPLPGVPVDQGDHVLREFEDTIFGQDQVVVESQRPERVPFDLAAELHLKFDAVAVAYRKAMRASGLAANGA